MVDSLSSPRMGEPAPLLRQHAALSTRRVECGVARGSTPARGVFIRGAQDLAERVLDLAERERALESRETRAAELMHALEERERRAQELLVTLNARESVVVEAEERLAEVCQTVAAASFRSGVSAARGHDENLDTIASVLALPLGLGPVPVTIRARGRHVTARVVPGSEVSAAEVLASVLSAVDMAEESSERQ